MPTVSTQPSLKSTQAVGAILLHQFARERFHEAGIGDDIEELLLQAKKDEDLDDLAAGDISTSSTATNRHEESQDSRNNTMYHSMNDSGSVPNTDPPILAAYGRELRQIAEEFARTRGRKAVKDKANKIELRDINKENFLKLLEELFQGGVTREKIAILFFFCTDVALRAASCAQGLVVQFMRWSFSFIINTFCRFVYEIGGWDKLLFWKLEYCQIQRIQSIVVNCLAIVGVLSLVFYGPRIFRTSS